MPRKRVESWITEEIEAWAAERPWCAVCYLPAERAWPRLQIHHLIHRSKRRCDAVVNLLILCQPCHESHHGMKRPGFPRLTTAHLFNVKLNCQDGWWNQDKLEEVNGGPLKFEPLPQEYLDERKLHRRYGV